MRNLSDAFEWEGAWSQYDDVNWTEDIKKELKFD
jgi:hypothetical protein